MKKISIIFTFVILTGAVSTPLEAPYNVFTLFNMSDIIVVGTPKDTATVRGAYGMPVKKVTLEVISLIKGDLDTNRLDAYYYFGGVHDRNTGNLFPDTMLAFLDTLWIKDYYHSLTRLPGAFDCTGDSLNAFISLTRDFYEIQKNSDDFWTDLTEWLVKYTENNATRREAWQILTSDSPMWSDDSTLNISFYKRLSHAQKERIYMAIIKTKEIDYFEISLLDRMRNHLDRRIYLSLVNFLRNNKNRNIYYAPEVIEMICKIKNCDWGKEYGKRYIKEREKPFGERDLNKIVYEFLALIDSE